MAARYIDANLIQYKDLPFSANDKVGVYVGYSSKSEIDEIPTADVQEVKHGEWLCINGTIFCSECQGKALYKYNENDNDDFPFLLPMKSKRCPHCGAKMDESTTNEY